MTSKNISVLKHCGPTLENLVLRRCVQIDDSVLLAIAEYLVIIIMIITKLLVVIFNVDYIQRNNHNIRTLSLSNCKKITDYGMCSITHLFLKIITKFDEAKK